MAIEDTIPTWSGNKQEDLNLGGTWDNSSVMISDNDSEWKVVMRRARDPRDMRPIRFVPMNRHSCKQDNCVGSLERLGNTINCVNEVTHGQDKWDKITVIVDSGAVDSVGPPTMATSVKVNDTPASGHE